MTKKYQTSVLDTSALAVPEQVSVAMEEIAADMREGLLALAVGADRLLTQGRLMRSLCSWQRAITGWSNKVQLYKSAASRSASAVSVIATNLRDTVDFDVEVATSWMLAPTGSRAAG